MRLIDADRLCNDLMERWSIADKKKEDTIRAVMADVVTPIVVSQPTVGAVPVVHGKWEKHKGIFICSRCLTGYKEQPTMMGKPMFDFCPVCGAKMDGKDGDGNES